jgi:glutaconate CoA-transferase subunit B
MSEYRRFTENEMMICMAARLMEDNKNYFIGFGMPQLATLVAQRLYSPNLVIVYEYGVIGPQIALPYERLMMADSKSNYRAVAWQNMNWAFFQAASGMIDYGMLGVNEIDQYGNINTTYIGGSYERPELRLSGSGGACEIGTYCWRTIAVMMHEKRRILEQLEFITTPGYLDGTPGARERAGLPPGTGPYRVVTSKALFGFDDETRKLKLLQVMPGSTLEEVLEHMQFRPLIAADLSEAAAPTEAELRLLREEIDPDRVVIGRGKVIEV